MKEFIEYDSNGNVTRREPFGADADNVNVTVDGTATDAESAIEDILDTLDGFAEDTGETSGVIVDGVGVLDTDMGNVKAGVNVDGLSISELLKAAYGEKNTFSILHLSDTHGGTACVNGCVSRANEDDEIRIHSPHRRHYSWNIQQDACSGMQMSLARHPRQPRRMGHLSK